MNFGVVILQLTPFQPFLPGLTTVKSGMFTTWEEVSMVFMLVVHMVI